MFEQYEIADMSLYNKRKIRGRDIWKLLPFEIAKHVSYIRLVKLFDKQVLYALFCNGSNGQIVYEYVPFSGKIIPNGSGCMNGYRKFRLGFRSFVQYEQQSDLQKVSRRRFCFCFRHRLYPLWDIVTLENKEGEEWKTRHKYDLIHCF